MELTPNEIAELKSILKNRRKAKPKSTGPKPIVKLLVGPHGRITGRVKVLADAKPSKGHKFIADDPKAKIGLLVKNGKAVHKSGKQVRMEHLDAKGERINLIVVDPDELPEIKKGEKLVKLEKGK